MATMKEMAREYRRNTAIFALRLKEKEEAGESKEALSALHTILTEMRAVQRQLDCYYEADKDPDLTMAGHIAARRKRTDDD